MRSQRNDSELMLRAKAGCHEGFRELARRWEAPLYRFFRRLGLQRSDAEDCLQDALLRVYRYRDRYDPAASFRSFAFHVARNVSVDFFRKQERWRRIENREGELEAEAPSAPWSDTLDCQWAVAQLHERLRIVVVLNIYEGFSYRETAAIAGIPLGTVKSRMHHALTQLRGLLCVAATA